MTDKEQDKEHKNMVLRKALKEELDEIIVRYSKSRMNPEMITATILMAAMKVETACIAAAIESLRKQGDIDKMFEETFGKDKEGS